MQCKSLWIKASAKCINVNVNVTVNERKPWSFVKEQLDDSICPSSDYKLIQLARQETALTPKLPDFPGWKHLFGRHFTQTSLPLKRSDLAGLGAKVKRANYKTFWFSTNSILSLAEEQVLKVLKASSHSCSALI